MNDIFMGAGRPLTAAGFRQAVEALELGDARAVLWAVLSVETSGFGYLPDRRPKILFERHVFQARTQGRFAASHPDLSSRSSGGWLGGAAEYQRLKRAMLLDRRAALESASWGLGQIMGYHAAGLGYTGVEAMIETFVSAGEDAQLDACARFIRAKAPLWSALRGRQWDRVAFYYNGAGYARRAYDRKLSQSYERFRTQEPDLTLRAVQALLAYRGFDPRGIDGLMGRHTVSALEAFRRHAGLASPSDPARLDDATLRALQQAGGLVEDGASDAGQRPWVAAAAMRARQAGAAGAAQGAPGLS